MPVKEAPEVLPEQATHVWVSAFNTAYETICEDQDGRDSCAAAIAWKAVKEAWHLVDDQWVRKKSLVHREMYITKVALDKRTAEMRWAAVCSDDKADHYQERMSLELFEDFIERIEKKELPPLMVRSDYWSGGLPYLSVSHYLDHDGNSSAGMATEVYLDGDRFKAKGIFEDNEIGNAAFKSVCKSVENEEPNPIRVSIAFYDYQHRHEDEDGKVLERFVRKGEADYCELCAKGVGTVVYEQGILVHLALTRIPANERTAIVGGLEVKSIMTTQLEDAESIVGEELAESVDEREQNVVGKSDALKVKSDVVEKDQVEEEIVEESAVEEIAEDESDTGAMTSDQMEQLADKMADLFTMSMKPVIRMDHPLAEVLANFANEFDTVWISDLTFEKKLQQLQEPLDSVAEAVREKMRGDEVSASESSDEASIEQVVDRAVSDRIQPLVDQISILTQQLSVRQAPQDDEEPVRRSVVPGQVPAPPPVDPMKPKSIAQLAQESTSGRLI